MIAGHLQVKGAPGRRKYFAHWTDGGGVKRTRTLGRAHVKDSGRRRVAAPWCGAPPTVLAPMGVDPEGGRRGGREDGVAPPPARVVAGRVRVPTFGDAAAGWLRYLEDD